MYTMNLKDTMDLIEFVAVEQKEPFMAWGPAGAGKSEGIAQLCDKLGGLMCDIRLSQYDSVDLRGIPVPEHERQHTVWYAPWTIPFKGSPQWEGHDGPIFLFLDELTSATIPVMAAAYQLINDRCIGEHELLDNVVIVAAGNRESDKGVVNKMPAPLANRFTHGEVMIDAETWCQDYAEPKGLPAVGIAFIQFRKPLLSTFDPSKPDKAFATPRTWAKALRYYADPKASNLTKRAAIAGAIGEGPATEFWGFVDVWGKLTPMDKILKDPTGVPMPDDIALSYAHAVAVSGEMSPTTVTPLHKFLKRMSPEYMVLAWQMAVRRDDAILASDEFLEMAQEHREIFQGT